MEVSQIKELDTHAVVGGGKAEAFGMSDSAEFFTVLSDTLYRDKVRAVAREVICNAWDAHIMVGKTDLPIEITLDEDELVIKDFGPGIAPELMRPIYCVYGASTKTKDGKQTGGFGLGSKSPFAYSDHFSVVSCHKGTRTVYAISRGGKETDGKPDMRAMVQVPTDQAGLTVTIPIASSTDRLDFERHIKSVVQQGGIKATLNGKELPTFDYGQARQTGFALMPHGVYELTEAKVYVLYGTVLYPVSTTDERVNAATESLAKQVEDNNARFVIVAPPHSIGITPSRESLSYSDRTTETILALLAKAEKFIRTNGPAAAARVARQRVKSLSGISDWADRVTLNSPSTGDLLITEPMKIAEYALATRFCDALGSQSAFALEIAAFAKKYPDFRRFYRRLAVRVRNHQQESRWGREADQIAQRAEFQRKTRLVRRLASKIGALNNILVSGDKWLIPLKEVRVSFSGIKLEDELIIARTRRDAQAYAKQIAGYGTRCLTLVLPDADDAMLERVEALCAQYKIDYEMLDFTRPEKKKPVRKPKTFFRFDEIKHDMKNGFYFLTGEPAVEKAPYYVRLYGQPGEIRMPTEWAHAFEKIKSMFPECVVAFDKVQEDRLQKAGAKPLTQFIVSELEKLGESRDVQYAYMAAGKLFIKDYYHPSSVAGLVSNLCAHDLRLAKHFFPARVRIGPKTDRAMALAGFVTQATISLDWNDKSELRSEFNIIKHRIESKARKTFADLITSASDLRHQYLEVLTNTYPHKFSVEHWFDLIATLKRTYEREQMRRQAASKKEAA